MQRTAVDDFVARYVAVSSLPGVAPRFDDVAVGHPMTMGLEEPHYHARLREIRDTVGVAPVWGIKDVSKLWVLTRFDDVQRAFLDTATFSPRLTQELHTFPFTGEQLLGLEGRKHGDFRRVVFPAFGKQAIPRYEDSVLRRWADALVDEFVDAGEADLMEVFTKRFPLVVIDEIMGLPVGRWEELAAWARAIILGPRAEDRAAAARSFREFVAPVIEDRRVHPGRDVVSLLVQGRVEGRPLTEDEIVSFLLLLFPAGVDTTWLALGSLLAAALSTPGAWQRLVERPEERARAIEETVRWEPPTPGIPRITARETAVAGVTIPADTLVQLNLASANREPGRFGAADPDVWDLDRRPAGHIGFGIGEHFCLGAHLARAEMRVGLDVLLARLPRPRLVEEPVFVGGAIRGPRAVRVAWG